MYSGGHQTTPYELTIDEWLYDKEVILQAASKFVKHFGYCWEGSLAVVSEIHIQQLSLV